MLVRILILAQLFIIGYTLLYNTVNFLLMVLAFWRIRFFLRERSVLDPEFAYASPYTPLISLIVPAHNEERTIVESVRALLRLRYPRLEVIVVNDGSTDRTREVLQEAFALVRRDLPHHAPLKTAPIKGLYEARSEKPAHVQRLILVDKEKGGKADALNAGINVALAPYICTVDADSLIDEKALLQLIAAVQKDPGQIVAIGGQVSVANGRVVEPGRVRSTQLPKRALVLLQFVEYLRSFTMGRTALAMLRALLILSGVFALYRRDVLIRIGGFLTENMRTRLGREYARDAPQTVTEDLEIILRLYRYMYDKKIEGRVDFLPYPIAWTEVPEVLADLRKQRKRWYRGLVENLLVFYRDMLFNRRYGRIGLLAMPYQVLFEVFGPVIELSGYLILLICIPLGLLSVEYAVLFFLSAVLYGIFVSTSAILFGIWSEAVYRSVGYHSLFTYSPKETLKLLLFTVLSHLGYRQLIILWQVGTLVDMVLGRAPTWEKIRRRGFSSAAPEQSLPEQGVIVPGSSAKG
ncbi:MAG: glycosyltransferase [Acidobacteriota bacterium]|nr:glycosyltransferase [Acidobacteriota bacterium]